MGFNKMKNPVNIDIYRVLIEFDIQIVLEVGIEPTLRRTGF
ncbi:hypothetical protein C7972_102289 [Arenibacter sp. ARW7G5Y1]|nr:hypothetical protein C7972_102289 [Arenibacter sp. ARW7G5Y1]|tara:strand:+ start:2384 stop:2506 length:123 start_codon:yes stop_codon:yes gene_type:complete